MEMKIKNLFEADIFKAYQGVVEDCRYYLPLKTKNVLALRIVNRATVPLFVVYGNRY